MCAQHGDLLNGSSMQENEKESGKKINKGVYLRTEREGLMRRRNKEERTLEKK